MGREEQVVNERIRKLNELRKMGVNPYSHRFEKKNDSKQLQEKYAKLKPDERTKDVVKVAGRLLTIRDLGNLAFCTLQDGTGKIQIVLQTKETNEKEFEIFKKDNEVVFLFGKYKGEVVAGAMIIFWSGIAFYHQAASLSKFSKFSIPYLL